MSRAFAEATRRVNACAARYLHSRLHVSPDESLRLIANLKAAYQARRAIDLARALHLEERSIRF